jgi:hypothetical protein
MSLNYLARIANARFPLVVTQARDIDSVLILKAAEMITASVPRGPMNEAADANGQAVVFGLTEHGEFALKRSQLPPEAPLQRGRADLADND